MSSAPGSSMSPKIDFDTRDKHLNVALHTYGRTIGPMPVQNFLDIFLPDTRLTAARRRNHFLHRIPTRKRYKPFVKALNKSKICPGFDFVSLDVNAKLLSTSVPQLGPNIAVYPRGEGPKSPCDWSLMDFFIEWRPDEDLDGYRSSFVNKQILDDDSEAAHEIRGRMFTYAAQLMDSQHRLFVFTVDIYGPRARLYRFDPSCIVVSDIIYFRKNPSLLEDFFLRYSACSSVQRGHDPTVTPANDAEKALFQASIKDYFNRARRNNLRTHPDVARLDNKIMKIQVNDLNGGVYWYLACKCSTIPVNSSPCGRFTRGFIAIPAPSDVNNPEDAEKGRLFWLKDSWRSNSSQSEASMYYELKARGVPNLPDIKCAGDILVGSCTQETTNDILLSDSNTKSWRRPTDVISHMVHIRLVSGILIPLEHIRNAKDLLLVGRDVLITIATVFHKANVYHRDLSKGNIMMTERRAEGEGQWGVLNDWDLARRIDAKSTGRTGTWQFISIPLLDDAKKAHDIFDDLESLLWVLLFFAVHYFKYRGAFNMRVFNEVCEYSDETNGTILMGGDSKLRWLQSPRITFECKPLQAFFNSFRSFHRERHWKIALSTDNEEEKKVLEDYEAETQKDIYKLVSHFDNILNDPNTDWSGQDAIGILPEEIPPPEDDKPDEEMDEPEVHPQPIPEVKGPQAKGKRGQKRTRDNLGPEDDNDRRRKRIATSKSNADRGTEGMGKSVTHARRRRIPAAPCNRVLRPQTRQ